MSKLTDLEKLIKLNEDEEKYSKGLQILNSGNIRSGGNKLTNFLLGLGLIGGVVYLSPKLPSQIQESFQKVIDNRQQQIEAIETESTEPPLPPAITNTTQPPLPPEIVTQPAPLPPQPQQIPQPVQAVQPTPVAPAYYEAPQGQYEWQRFY